MAQLTFIKRTGTTLACIFVFTLTSVLSSCSKKQPADLRAEEAVSHFYQWYISYAYKNKFDYYQVPPFKKVGANSYVFDREELGRRLKGIEYFSESLKARLLNKLEACNNEMLKETWEYEPEPQFNIDACNYLWFDNWIGGQGEDIDGFSIIGSKQAAENLKFQVEIQIKKKKFTQADVTVVKEADSYKIDDIRVVWN